MDTNPDTTIPAPDIDWCAVCEAAVVECPAVVCGRCLDTEAAVNDALGVPVPQGVTG